MKNNLIHWSACGKGERRYEKCNLFVFFRWLFLNNASVLGLGFLLILYF